MTRQRKKIDTNLYEIGGHLYVEKSQGKKVILKRKAPYQGSAALNRDGKPTRKLLRWRDDMIYAILNGNADDITRSRSESYPSVQEVMDAYREFSLRMHQANGSPRPVSVNSACRAMKTICHRLRLSTAVSIDRLTHDLMLDYVSGYPNKASGWSNVNNAKCLFAKWTRKEYTKAGIKLPEIDWPKPMRNNRKKYERAPKELRAATLALYAALERTDPPAWCALTLALNFATRRNDAIRLTFADNFADGLLQYNPIKVAGRTNETRNIIWPVDPALLAKLKAAADHSHCIPANSITARTEIIERVVKHLREIGWEKDKPYHEMRKLCVDAVYRKMGLEKAVQISGDNPATVVYYYSDPRLEDRQTIDITQML